MFYKLKYTNENGEVLDFKPSVNKFTDLSEINTDVKYPYRLQKFEGFGELKSNIDTVKAPYQDGSTIVGMTFAERYPYLQFIIDAKDYDALSDYRRKAIRILNPKLDGKFELNYGEHTFVLDVKPESVPVFGDEDVAGRTQAVSINFIAANPYWKSPIIQEEPMAAFVELFEFPSDYWELGEDGDIYFEMGTEGHTRTFVNNGDGAVPIKIRIKGPTLNPTLTNLTTGELIKINRELSADDVLEISTEDADKYILLNGENVFNWIDLSSTFWKLEVGENEIQYTADAGLESATLEITWQEQFVGV